MIKELAKIGNGDGKRMLVRRISRSLSKNSDRSEAPGTPTGEELAFAKLMAVLCISFVICWMPQMVRLEEIFKSTPFHCAFPDFHPDGATGTEVAVQRSVFQNGGYFNGGAFHAGPVHLRTSAF